MANWQSYNSQTGVLTTYGSATGPTGGSVTQNVVQTPSGANQVTPLTPAQQAQLDPRYKTGGNPDTPEKYGNTGNYSGSNPQDAKAQEEAQKQAKLNELYAKIDAMDYSPEQKLILKQIARDDSVSGRSVRSMDEIAKIVSNAAIKAEADIAPYHDKMTAREINDLKTNMESIRSESQRYGQQEAVDYTKQLNDTKQSLRVRGLTFGGAGRKQLGASGIIDSAGVAGTIPTQRQATWEDKIAGWQGRANTLQTASQRALGLDEYGQIQGLPTTIVTPTDLLRPINAPMTVNQTNPTDIGIGDLNAQRLKDKALAQINIIQGYTSSI